MTEPRTKPESPTDLDIARLYDAYAPRLYAVALRITGNETLAGDVLHELLGALARRTLAFDGHGSFDAWLLRHLRDYALARRQDRTASPGVDLTDASPRSLIEAAYFGGASVADLARASSLSEDEIRARVLDGMRSLRVQFAGRTS